jgi:putative transposase
VPERIEAGHPEQNGRHERMHRTLKQETAQPPAANRREQQRTLDRFRQEYNEVRLHEALEMQTPAAVFQPSARQFPASVPEPDYPKGMLVRSIRPHGHFRWKNKYDIFLSEILWGERVGLLPEDDRWFTIYFAQLPLARFDSRKLQVTPLPKTGGFDTTHAEQEDSSSSSVPNPLTGQNQKVSAMCPV